MNGPYTAMIRVIRDRAEVDNGTITIAYSVIRYETTGSQHE